MYVAWHLCLPTFESKAKKCARLANHLIVSPSSSWIVSWSQSSEQSHKIRSLTKSSMLVISARRDMCGTLKESFLRYVWFRLTENYLLFVLDNQCLYLMIFLIGEMDKIVFESMNRYECLRWNTTMKTMTFGCNVFTWLESWLANLPPPNVPPSEMKV